MTTLTGLGSSTYISQPVTFTATVSTTTTGPPTGTITFTDGATVWQTVPLSGGVATFSTAGLTLGDHSIKSLLDPVAIGFRDNECRKQLDGVACVARDLAEDFVIFKQWYGDELAEEAGVHCFKKRPSRLEF